MSTLGIIIGIIGLAASGLLFTHSAPEFLQSIPVPLLGWAGIAAGGMVLFFWTRRAAD